MTRKGTLATILLACIATWLHAQEPLTQSSASVYIWADKYHYRPGDSLSLRWSVKANGDSNQYSLVAYRQNNQTGQRFYLPAGTEEVTDIFGNAPGSFRVQSAVDTEATRQVLLGEGGLLGGAVTIPEQYGMHTLVFQFRDPSGNRVVKSAYFKFSVVRGERIVVDSNITRDTTWTRDRHYHISGTILVRDGATLTIEPGTIITGEPGSQPPSVLVVSTDGRIVADGTRSRPIIFTSAQPFGQRRPQDWGGIIMLGLAPINVQGGTSQIEGLTPSPETIFGGTRANHDCGIMRYVRIEYAGSILGANNEVNGLTTGGCGTRTVIDHVQVHLGLDDAFEFFGGTHDAKYIVASYMIDDGIDLDFGYNGRIQHAVVLAGPATTGTNNGAEIDGNGNQPNNQPYTEPRWYNVTMVGNDSSASNQNETDVAGIYIRRGTGGHYRNTLIYNWRQAALSTSSNAAQGFATLEPRIASGNLSVDGLLMWENGNGRSNDLEGQVLDRMRPLLTNTNASKRVAYSDPMLRRPFDFSDPDFRALAASLVRGAMWIAPPDDGFFDQWANYIGAFGDFDWTEEWTSFLLDEDIRNN